MKFYEAVELLKNELKSAKIENLASPPSTPATGQIYFDSALLSLGFYNGTSWIYIAVSLSDGDKGDITVSSGGTVMSIDSETISLAKLTQETQNYIIAMAVVL